MKNVSILLILLAHSIVHAQDWKSNLNDALEEATVSREVLLLFSVPDNCSSCQELEKKIMDSPEFLSYAKQNFVLAKQDFKSDNVEENLLVVEKYNKDGFFPLVVLINKNGKIVGQLGTYNNETPAQYIAKLESVRKS